MPLFSDIKGIDSFSIRMREIQESHCIYTYEKVRLLSLIHI